MTSEDVIGSVNLLQCLFNCKVVTGCARMVQKCSYCWQFALYRLRSRGDNINMFGSVRACVCPSVCPSVGALMFEPVVRSRSILGLGLPSSANDNCE